MTAGLADPHTKMAHVRAADARAIGDAAVAIRAGLLVAFPTETVYGLGANALDGKAVAAIFAAKRRPRFNPLIIHVADTVEARRHGVFSEDAEKLAKEFWPGPLTLVAPKRPQSEVADLATAGLDTIALRVPAGEVARELLQRAGVPIAAPSANLSGHVSATTAAHVASDLGDAVEMVLDGGPTRHGLESTIVRVVEGEPPQLLRAGAIERDAIEIVLGRSLTAPTDGEVTAPGQLGSHYAPRTELRLDATDLRPEEVMLAFGAPPPGIEPALNLSATGDLVEAAANLFSHLRRLDEMEVRRAAVMPIPKTGLGEAINDRLTRAAAPRRRGKGKTR